MGGMFDSSMMRSGLEYVVYRNDQVIGNTRGLAPNKGEIQLMSAPVIKDGDKLYLPMMDKYYLVTEARPIIGRDGRVEAWEASYEVPAVPAVPTINIGSIHGPAVVGSQQSVTLNFGASINDLRTLIASKPAEIQSELADLPDALADTKEIKRGGLQRFGSILAKHSDLAIVVGKIILAFATGAND